MASEAHDLKNERLEFRVPTRLKETFRAAAETKAKPLSAFVLDAAEAEAQRVLSERTIFALDAERWARFNEALDRPAMDKPRLRALLAAPSVFDED